MSTRKNIGLLLIALIIFIGLLTVIFAASSFAGVIPSAFESQFVAHCASSACGIG